MNNNRYAVSLPGLELKNPFMPSSGSFYYGLDHIDDFDLNELGALVLKTTTMHPRKGNPQPWIIQTKAGVLNSVGLANPGIAAVKADYLPKLAEKLPNLPQMLSISGETIAEFTELATIIDQIPSISAIELNLSCPNVDEGGRAFGVSTTGITAAVSAVRAVTTKAVYAKLSPNVTDIKPLAIAAQKAGADGLTMVNTLVGMSLDLMARSVRLYRGKGGLSGEAIHPLAVEFIWEAASVVDIPIIGVGGVTTIDDALELMLAGASAVQVGIMNKEDSLFLPKLIKQLPAALDKYHFETAADVTYALHPLPTDEDAWAKSKEK
ncbi:dihydroorotate dehydrogenase [Weissella hellenica]|uniref:Dihydroorotate dehydrogenase n=1 Tax=Weissella hellenica TaxID=46256 RepID=A0A4Y4FZQ1_WEIHE|nr:dihydroorotate dehydrogenase [Weissella hellenica]NKY66183.1 dihydroorotate dehydrogenase [Weissella hellenica]GED35642.1 dihydroorotate dehydrogenase B (NAD(+)), catalytic subunit [Weissella hellenica]SCB78269.1 dihydroorotate dehydrogenase (NAD+) catalytic subunit [Weissella hellenica]